MTRMWMIVAVACALAGCSSQQVYATGQAYQRNQCRKLPDAGEREQCLERNDMGYEDYRRRTQSGP